MIKKYQSQIKRKFNPNLKPVLDDWRDRRNKLIFPYSGIHIYAGWQGSGKTASMIYHLNKLKKKYPNALISSNIKLNNMDSIKLELSSEQYAQVEKYGDNRSQMLIKRYLRENLQQILQDINPKKQYLLFEDADELSTIMFLVRRGNAGHILAIDEVHLYLNSTKSKETSIETFASISQLRKNRTVILGTSQLATRLEKALREQMTTIINCNTYFGVLTTQKVLDAHTLEYDPNTNSLMGDVLKKGFFFQTRELRNSYDTMQIVQPADQLYQNQIVIRNEIKPG